MQPSFLKVTKEGQDILDMPVYNTMNIGIGHLQQLTGIVPFFEEHSIRQKLGYTLGDWNALSLEERAFEVAVFRLSQAVESHFKDAEIDKMKSSSRK